MKMRIGDLTLEQFSKICNEHVMCDNCPLLRGTECLYGKWDIEADIPDKYFDERVTNKHYKYSGVHGTSWSGGGGVNGYVLKFETDDDALYKYMEKAAKHCIDITHRKKKEKKQCTE